MRRKNNLYHKITDIETIKLMYDKRIKLNTKNKYKIHRFDNNYVSNIAFIKAILDSKNYIPGHYNLFIIKEPKVRLIMSQNIIDKIINHLVSQYFLVDIFDKILIDYNVATRKNKGTHYGFKYLTKYLKHNIHKDLYVLKFDISKYFYNLDHDILKKIIKTKIKDKDVLNIIDNIIDSTDLDYVNKSIDKLKKSAIANTNNRYIMEQIHNIPYYQTGKGLPIGNMTSQALAIIYLNELDHYIVEKLKIKCYIRFMDDGVLVSDDKKYLKYCLEKIKALINEYKLELNDKTVICPLTHGFEFLGFHFQKRNNRLVVKVKNQTKRKFKYKLKKISKLYLNKQVSFDDFYQVQASYEGHLKYGDTKGLRDSVLGKYQNIIKEGLVNRWKKKRHKRYLDKKYQSKLNKRNKKKLKKQNNQKI